MTRPWTPRQVQDYYSKCLAEHGSGPLAVGWGSKESQELRFKVLVEVCGHPACLQGCTIADVGCGTGDLYQYLLDQRLQSLSYTGYESNGEAVKVAQLRFGAGQEGGSSARFYRSNLLDRVQIPGRLSATWDYVFASGLFTFSNCRQFEVLIGWLYAQAKKVLAFNVLSSWAPEHRVGHFYLEPSRALALAARIQREVDGGPGRILLRHDYLPHDMTVYMYRGKRA